MQVYVAMMSEGDGQPHCLGVYKTEAEAIEACAETSDTAGGAIAITLALNENGFMTTDDGEDLGIDRADFTV